MAFIRASQGGCGELTETTIWTNSSPTSQFAQTTITLDSSYKISDFKYLKFVFRKSTSDMVEQSVMVDTGDFVYALQQADCMMPAITFIGSTVTYVRRIFYKSDTQITIDKNNQVGGNASTNQYTIPVEIIGLK